MKKIIRMGMRGLLLSLSVAENVLAVWPPSTAFGEKTPVTIYSYILIAFVTGVAVGIWAKRNHNEHK